MHSAAGTKITPKRKKSGEGKKAEREKKRREDRRKKSGEGKKAGTDALNQIFRGDTTWDATLPATARDATMNENI